MYAQEAFTFSQSERTLLHGIHQQALAYSLDNQLSNGWILDRQHNHGRRSYHGLISTSATGMGLMCIALAANDNHRLIARSEACSRVHKALLAGLALPHVQGMSAHFLDADTLEAVGADRVSTIDYSWFIAGALWAAECLGDSELQKLAHRLYRCVNWLYWGCKPPQHASGKTSTSLLSHNLDAGGKTSTSLVSHNLDASGKTSTPLLSHSLDTSGKTSASLLSHSLDASGKTSASLLSHGLDASGNLLPGVWDRHNAETLFMYILALGAAPAKALPLSSWEALGAFYGSVYELSCVSGDLGLFVYQYSRELLDITQLPKLNGRELAHEWEKPVLANYAACRSLAGRQQFKTFDRFWGLSAGDGPPDQAGQNDSYKAYAPNGVVDGTAHVTATLASIGVWPGLVRENLRAVQDSTWRKARGRYGYSNINVDRNWYSRDVVGIDICMAALALENALYDGGVRQVFHRLAPVRRALLRLNSNS